MPGLPAHPKIYHITHMDNLPGILGDGCLWSDAERLARGLSCALVGMSRIKRRRLEEIGVECHPGTMVGQYVPFYFCPRSIMLFILHRGNNPDITYSGGQGPIVHLRADLHTVIEWAQDKRVRWAFSDRNAGAYVAKFRKDPAKLDRLNWEAIRSTDFRDPIVKEGKQAEFLLFGSFPWELVEHIGVHNPATLRAVNGVLAEARHQPPARIEPNWYY